MIESLSSGLKINVGTLLLQEEQLVERQALTDKNSQMAQTAERMEAQRVEEQPQVEELER